VPAFNLSGWNDDPYGQPGAIRNFVGMKQHGGSEVARQGQRLTMGPWTHGVPSLSRTGYAGTDFGPNATYDFVDEQLRFFDYWLKKKDDGFSREPAVRIFVMGDNRWRHEETWPPRRTTYDAWQLNPGGTLTRASAQPHAGRTEFVYDPRTPARVPPASATSRPEWRGVTSRADVIEFTSEPLTAPVEITGHVLAHLWFTSSAPDTDVTVRILAVRSDGSSYALTNAYGALRARYRSTETPQPEQRLPSGTPVELTISLGYTSIVMPAGERLQVMIAGSMRQGLTIHPNVWEVSSAAAMPVPATNVVHHGPEFPSRVVLPVIPRQ
jgi:uncharacterized protein